MMSLADHPVDHVQQKVAWLELFYDLAYVVVIARATALLEGDPSGGRIAATLGLVGLVWLAWINVTALIDLVDGLRGLARLAVFVSMAGVGLMAIGIGDIIEGHPTIFVLGYAVARFAVWPLWIAERRRHGQRWVQPVLYAVACFLLLAEVLLPHGQAWLGLVVLAVTEARISTLHDTDARTRFEGAYLIERLGLLLLIVLGESVAQVIDAADAARTGSGWVTAALALAVVCALWWLIHDATLGRVEARLGRSPVNILDELGGSQFTMLAGLTLLAGALSNAIEHTAAGHSHAGFSTGGRICLALGYALVSMGSTSMSRRAAGIHLAGHALVVRWPLRAAGLAVLGGGIWILSADRPGWAVLTVVLALVIFAIASGSRQFAVNAV